MSRELCHEKFRLSVLTFTTLLFLIKPAAALEYQISTVDTDPARLLSVKAEKAYQLIGHKVRFHFQPIKRSLREVNSGTYDAALAQVRGIKFLFPNLVMIPEPIFEVSISAVVRKNSGIDVVTWDNLKTLSFASPFQKDLLEIRMGGDYGVTVQSPENIIKMISRGRIDVGLLLTVDALKFAALDPNVAVQDQLMDKVKLYHFVHKKNRDLVPALTKAFEQINKNGLAAGVIY